MSKKLCIVTAHSGCENTVPNSQDYIEKALNSGCDIVEIDIRKNEQGFYLSHDMPSPDTSFFFLEQALEQFEAVPSACINFDLKEDVLPSLIEFLEQKNFMHRSFFSGCISPETFRSLKRAKDRVLYNISVSEKKDEASSFLSELKHDLPGIKALNLSFEEVTKDFVFACHKQGLQVFVWTPDNDVDMKNMIDYAVDGITTNRVAKALEYTAGITKQNTVTYDIVCIGPVSKDIMIDHLGHEDRLLGGAIIQSGYAASGAGFKTAVCTKCNDTDADVLAELDKAPMDVYHLYSADTTSIRNTYFTADKEQRSCDLISESAPFYLCDILKVPALIYHFAGLTTGDFDDALFKAIHGRGKIAVDAQCLLRRPSSSGSMDYDDWKHKRDYISYIDYFKADAKEAEILTGCSNTHEAAALLCEWGAPEVLITHNTEVIVRTKDVFYSCPIKARSLDGRTGRGDTTFASYIASRNTAGIPESLLFATALVSLKMETKGPFRGERSDIERYIADFYTDGDVHSLI
ncbi:PfkB family carbohydrate kinase [Treponema sp. HNW]|uniref:glycerophosphodiester phosphodiesterase family protein n=1 Tax=Treponema sp. HNW TaxID=3116654 RepID=UPI003D0ACC60